MVYAIMRVGPKGQVVIPKIFRDEYGIATGDKITFREEKEGLLIKKTDKDVVAIFEKIAKTGKPVTKIDLHGYETELENRWKRSK